MLARESSGLQISQLAPEFLKAGGYDYRDSIHDCSNSFGVRRRDSTAAARKNIARLAYRSTAEKKSERCTDFIGKQLCMAEKMQRP
jgi:hypothetical protein